VQNSRCGNDGPSSFQRVSGGTPRGQQQIVTVASCDGNSSVGHACSSGTNVGISPGLYASNWTGNKSPGAWWASNPIYNVGFENFSWTASSNSAGGAFLFNCQGCWFKGVRGILTSSPSGYGWGNIVAQWCNKCTVRDSYFHGAANVDDYVVAIDGASDFLVENNIMQYPGTIQFYSADCEGCVSGYNYSAGMIYGDGSSAWMATSGMLHSVTILSLGEGNIGNAFWGDGYHGSHVLNTQFRNRFDGREPDGTTETTGNTAAIQLAPGSRYFNFIGNVLGTVGYHTTYLSTPSADHTWSAVIVAGQFPGTGGTDTLPYPTSMWWGNWDVVTNAVRWCGNSNDTGWSTTCSSASEVPSSGLPNTNAYANPVPASEALPASFYLDAKPLWWPASKAWPNIGPGVTGGTVGQCAGGTMQASSCSANSQCPGSSCSVIANGRVVSNPAMDCYFNVMGGSANGTGPALAFDTAACYPTLSSGGGGGGSVNPPSGLAATVQ
jgi:hypothetical protein